MKSLTLRLVNGIILIPIVSYLITLVFSGFVGSEALEGSMIEEYFICVALLTIIFIGKEILNERYNVKCIKILLRRKHK